MKITPGLVLKLAGEINAILTAEGVFDPAGNLVQPVSPIAVAKAATDIEQLIKAAGVVIPVKVDQVILALPIFFSLAGLK